MNGSLVEQQFVIKSNLHSDAVANLVGGMHLRDSPLQIFVRAKKKINDIYQEIQEFVFETHVFVQSLPQDKNIIESHIVSDVAAYGARASGIKEVLSRDHMKVAFFGRTSNGKSAVINAMLGDKILPTGIGHTTNCFLQVEGSDSSDPYITTEGCSEHQNLSGIGQLAHALCNNRLGDSTLVKIYWPKTRCALLRDDVVLVDSPGIDVSVSLDEWIDKHCLDADVFVLVANSESTLMNTEKNFFHKVSEKLSKPNIFVLQNRWDVAATEPEYLNEVRKQHMERTISFLVDELKVSHSKEAEQRVFFVSAKEVLLYRLNQNKGEEIKSNFPDGFNSRLLEFQSFESAFEECISKTAIITKFNQHVLRGKAISSELQEIINRIQENVFQSKEQKINERESLLSKLDHTENELNSITLQMKDKISSIVDDVERRVSSALNDEIRRLSVLVDEFNEPFHPDTLVLNVYKKSLHSHVEAGLGSNLRTRLSSALALNIESSQQEMTRRMLALLGPHKTDVAISILPRREPFEVLYRLNCENLCADFQISRSLSTPLTPSNDHAFGVSQDDISVISKFALAGVSSHGTMGAALALGLMFKTVGWRLIILVSTIYGCLYAYERLTWTNKAKERVFKKQYVEHATRKLRLIVDLTSHNCSHQVQQELSGIFARLCRLVDESTSEMQRDIRSLEKEMQSLDNFAVKSKKLKNKSHYLMNELNVFQKIYLLQE